MTHKTEAEPRFNEFRPADILTVVFASLLMILTGIFFKKVPSAGYLMLIYSSIMIFQIILIYLSKVNKLLALFRDLVFPVIGVLIIFDSLGLIVHKINPQDIDYVLIRLDYLIFGNYPTVYLERIMHPLLTDVLEVAYSTYYFMPIALGIAVKLKGKNENFEKTLFFILLCFYLSYVGYMLFPALGPRYSIKHLQGKELGGLLLSEQIQNVLNLLEGVKRDAFPSGHTGVALTVLFLAFRFAKRLFWMLLPLALLLILATVYCRYHYVVDVIAGVVLTVVTITVGELYYKVQLRRNHG
ncbi:MAG: phosphatase PAP2 family protein [Dissulfurispiraceae bacterium]